MAIQEQALYVCTADMSRAGQNKAAACSQQQSSLRASMRQGALIHGVLPVALVATANALGVPWAAHTFAESTATLPL
jgi:hypothetical protein